MKMHKVSPWLFFVIALMMLLPLVGVAFASWMSWVTVIAFVLIGILELTRGK